jgi:hypothetical protein
MRTEYTVGQGTCWPTSGQVSHLDGGMITSVERTCVRLAAPISLPKSDMRFSCPAHEVTVHLAGLLLAYPLPARPAPRSARPARSAARRASASRSQALSSSSSVTHARSHAASSDAGICGVSGTSRTPSERPMVSQKHAERALLAPPGTRHASARLHHRSIRPNSYKRAVGSGPATRVSLRRG